MKLKNTILLSKSSFLFTLIFYSFVLTVLIFQIFMTRHNVFNLFSNDFIIQYHNIKNFPWTDVSENILAGYFLSKNLILYEDFVMNHFPGLPLLLSFFYNFGSKNIIAGGNTLNYLYFLGFFTFHIIQNYFLFKSFDLFSSSNKKKWTYVILTSTVLCFYYRLFFPCTQVLFISIIFLLLSKLTNLIYKINSNTLYKFEYINIFCLLFISLIIGLNAFLFIFIFFIFFLLLIIKNKKKLIFSRKYLTKDILISRIDLGIFLLSIFLFVSLFSLNLYKMFYWSISFNLDHIAINYMDNIIKLFSFERLLNIDIQGGHILLNNSFLDILLIFLICLILWFKFNYKIISSLVPIFFISIFWRDISFNSCIMSLGIYLFCITFFLNCFRIENDL